jgi:hypothetical protein
VKKATTPAVARTGIEIGTFDRDAFERAWQHDDTPAARRSTPEAAILVSRTSPNDFQDRQIYLWIDEEPIGKIRYGDAVSRPIEPGRHSIRVFNTLFTRTLIVDAAPGEQVRVQCGTGMPVAGWLLMIFLHVTYLRVWVMREGS